MQTFQLPGLRLPSCDLGFAPDGRTLVAGGSVLTFIDTAGGELRSVPELGLGYGDFGFVRNGAALVLAGSDELEVLDWATGAVQRHRTGAGVFAVAAVPSGARLFASVGNYLFEAPAADPTRLKQFGESHAFATPRLVLSADGSRLVAYLAPRFCLWDVCGDGPPVPRTAFGPGPCRAFTLSADGALAAAVFSTALTVWDTDTGTQVFHSGQHRRTVTAVACSPARPLVATGDNAGRVFLWDHAGRVLTQYEWELGPIAGLCFAPDGLRCAAVDAQGKVVIWDVDV